MHGGSTNTKNTPVEALERTYPMRGDEATAGRLPDKCTIQLRAGDVLRMRTPGGGGWGTAARVAPHQEAGRLLVCGQPSTRQDGW
jgi:N-methylhydantoinase B/oxoprolinase/acetone carboxylase alpha subunit